MNERGRREEAAVRVECFHLPHIDLTVSQLRDENSDLSLLRCPSHSVALSPFYPSHSLFLSQGYTLKWQDLHGAR